VEEASLSDQARLFVVLKKTLYGEYYFSS